MLYYIWNPFFCITLVSFINLPILYIINIMIYYVYWIVHRFQNSIITSTLYWWLLKSKSKIVWEMWLVIDCECTVHLSLMMFWMINCNGMNWTLVRIFAYLFLIILKILELKMCICCIFSLLFMYTVSISLNIIVLWFR